MPYGALLVIAGQLANVHELAAGRLPHAASGRGPGWWIAYGVGLVITILLWGALILRQSALAAGAPSSMSAELRAALGRLPQLVAVTLLAAAAVAAGLVLLVVPGLYLAVAFVFAAPVLLLRQGGVLRALTECARLVRGLWWRTALTLAVVALTTLVLYVLLATIIAAASATVAGAADRALVAAVSTAAGVIVGSVSAPFGSAMILATFGDLSLRAGERLGSG